MNSIVTTGSCQVTASFRPVITTCAGSYSSSNEDRTFLNPIGWKKQEITENIEHSSNVTLTINNCPKPWRFYSASTLETITLWGRTTSYGGGGYVADLGYTSETADKVSKSLEANGWIDKRSRALILQLILFNGNTNMLSVVTYLFEIFPTGGVLSLQKFNTVPIYTSDSNSGYMLYLLCQLVFLCFVLAYFVAECWAIHRKRGIYFKNRWKVLEWFIILTCIVLANLYIVKAVLSSRVIQQIHANPYTDFSFDYITLTLELEDALFGFLLFVTTIKLLKLLKFNTHIVILSGSMRISARSLISFTIVFAVICFAFAQLGILMFGTEVQYYSSFYSTLISELHLVLGGDMHHEELIAANRLTGPLYIFMFILFVGFVFVNMFFAIMNDARSNQKQNLTNVADDLQFVEFASRKIKMLLGFYKDQTSSTKTLNAEDNTKNLTNEYVSAKAENYIPRRDSCCREEENTKLTMIEQRKMSIEMHKKEKDFDFSEMINVSLYKENVKIKNSRKKTFKKYKPSLGSINETGKVWNLKKNVIRDVEHICYKISSIEGLVNRIELDYAFEDVELMRLLFENILQFNMSSLKRRDSGRVWEEKTHCSPKTDQDSEITFLCEKEKSSTVPPCHQETHPFLLDIEDYEARREPDDYIFEDEVRGVFPIISGYRNKSMRSVGIGAIAVHRMKNSKEKHK